MKTGNYGRYGEKRWCAGCAKKDGRQGMLPAQAREAAVAAAKKKRSKNDSPPEAIVQSAAKKTRRTTLSPVIVGVGTAAKPKEKEKEAGSPDHGDGSGEECAQCVAGCDKLKGHNGAHMLKLSPPPKSGERESNRESNRESKAPAAYDPALEAAKPQRPGDVALQAEVAAAARHGAADKLKEAARAQPEADADEDEDEQEEAPSEPLSEAAAKKAADDRSKAWLASATGGRSQRASAREVIRDHDELGKNDGFCIKNDGFCIKFDGFYIKMMANVGVDEDEATGLAMSASVNDFRLFELVFERLSSI